MKSKKTIFLIVALAILCMGIYLMIDKKGNKSDVSPNAALIYEETVSPNEKYVLNARDVVYYTIRVYQDKNHTITVSADSNSLLFEATDYSVPFDQELLESDVHIKWMTLSGSTEETEENQWGLAEVTISQNGEVVNQKRVSFVSKGVKAITDVIG